MGDSTRSSTLQTSESRSTCSVRSESKASKPSLRFYRAAATAAIILLFAFGCGGAPTPHPTCEAREIPPDETTSAPRPDETRASFYFHGNNPEQREFVFLHEDGSYDYAERWDMGIPADDELQFAMGWDWKVDCRMHTCPMPDGTVCCFQTCRDGGASGVGYEAPDQFDCMNQAEGGSYDWFIEGLRNNGMPELSVCLESTGT